MPTAALKAGEVVAAEPEPVLVGRGVEVPAGPGVEPGPAEDEPAAEELVAVMEAELDEEPVAETEAEEDSPVLELPLLVSVAVALVSEGVLLPEVAELAEEVVVSTGGTTMGWPAEEHWATTALDTAVPLVSGLCYI
jgi:hypothetical protein